MFSFFLVSFETVIAKRIMLCCAKLFLFVLLEIKSVVKYGTLKFRRVEFVYVFSQRMPDLRTELQPVAQCVVCERGGYEILRENCL